MEKEQKGVREMGNEEKMGLTASGRTQRGRGESV